MDNQPSPTPPSSMVEAKVRTSHEHLEATLDPEVLSHARSVSMGQAQAAQYSTSVHPVYTETIVEHFDPYWEDRTDTEMRRLDDGTFGVRSISHQE